MDTSRDVVDLTTADEDAVTRAEDDLAAVEAELEEVWLLLPGLTADPVLTYSSTAVGTIP